MPLADLAARRGGPRPCGSAACGCRRWRRPACSIATWRSRSSAVPDCATTSKPASSSSRRRPRAAAPSRRRAPRGARRRAARRCRASGGKSRGSPSAIDLVDALGIGKALQAVGAEIARLDAGDERRRGGGQQHLTAVPRGRDARGADHVQTGVALLAELRYAGVKAHPHLDDCALRPAVVADPCLAGERRSKCRLDLAEHCRELVAGRVDLGPRTPSRSPPAAGAARPR